MYMLVDDMYALMPGSYLFCMHSSSVDSVCHVNVYAQNSPQELGNQARKRQAELHSRCQYVQRRIPKNMNLMPSFKTHLLCSMATNMGVVLSTTNKYARYDHH